MIKGEGLIKVSKKVKIGENDVYGALFWVLRGLAGGLREGCSLIRVSILII